MIQRQEAIFFQRPHNDFIWVLSESGTLGLLPYMAILGVAIFYAIVGYTRLRSEAHVKNALSVHVANRGLANTTV